MKKTILLLNSDRFFYPNALDQFLSKNSNRISKIFVFPAFTDSKKKKAYELASMRIMGFRFVANYLLKTSSRFILELLPIPLRHKRKCSLESIARYYQIPLQHMDSVNSPELIQQILEEKYETGLSMVSQIYTSEILSLTNFTLFNFHPSILPRNKGKFPIFWAFLREEKEQGVTCHQITKKIDDGQILFQKEFRMEPDDTVSSVLYRFVADIPGYLEEALQRIESQNFESIPNNYSSFYGPTPNQQQIRKYWQLMKEKNSKSLIRKLLDQIKKNYEAPWYPLAIALVTAANVFMVFLPVEAIIAGGVLLKPKSWGRMAFWNTLAATISTMILTLLVMWKGQEALDWLAPNLQHSNSWIRSTEMMKEWGLWALSLISILPVPTLPGVAFAVFSKMSFSSIFFAVFAGRAIKFYGLCFIAAYFPTLIRKKAPVT